VILIGALAAAGAVSLSACGSKSKSTASTPSNTSSAPATAVPSNKIAVRAGEFFFKPAPAKGKAGEVTFTVHNTGHLKHEFVVIKGNKPAGELADKKGSEASEKGAVDEIDNLPPGSTKTLKVKLTPGHYSLICNLPKHYGNGQHVDFTVVKS
jgi:Uncharacterized copper-binding protein